MPRLRTSLLAIPVLLLAIGARAAEGDPRSEASGRGRLAWIFSDDLDLAGGLAVHLPWALGETQALALDIDTTAAIRKASSLAFEVRDLEYQASLDLLHRTQHGWFLSGFLEQWGKERTDAAGAPFLRSAGVSFESSAYRTRPPGRGFEGRAAAGIVFEDRGLDAAAVLHGDLRFGYPGDRLGVGLDLRFDALLGGDGESLDLEAGPRLDVLRTPSSCASFYLHYLHARTPLGLDTTGVVLGFEDVGGARGATVSPPEVRGELSAGGGGERGAASLALRFLSAPFLHERTWVAADFDLELLSASDVSDLYYVYDVGLETLLGGAQEGLYFRHRSNHRLSEPGTSITSVDLVEAGIETLAWSHPQALARGRRGSWDAIARVGVLVDTSFGESGHVHGLAGARYVLPRAPGARLLPYARVEVEDGQVGRRSYALGVLAPSDLDARLAYLRDSQLYAQDKTALLLTLGRSF